MSQELKVNEIYKSLLALAGAEVDENGFIFQTSLGTKTPMVVSGKSVVLPYRAHLRDPKGNAIFHPLGEVVVRAESEVLARYRKWLNLRLNNAIQGIAYRLLRLVASTEVHKRLTPEQSEVIYAVTDVDEKSYVNFCKAAIRIFGDENKLDSGFVNIYLRRGGEYAGKKAFCVGVTTFHFYQRLLSEEAKTEIGCRVADVKAWRKLFEFIFPDIGEKETYNFGSYSEVAKYTDALVGSAVKIAECLNQIIRIFRTGKGNLLDEMTSDGDVGVESLYFDTAVTEWFRNIDSHKALIAEVPVQSEPGLEEQPKTTIASQQQVKPQTATKKALTLKDVAANQQAAVAQGGFGFNQNQGQFGGGFQQRASFSGGFGGGFSQPTDPLLIAQMQENAKNNQQSQQTTGFGRPTNNGLMPGSRVNIPNTGEFIVAADGSLVPIGAANAGGFNNGFAFGQPQTRTVPNNEFVFGNVRRR